MNSISLIPPRHKLGDKLSAETSGNWKRRRWTLGLSLVGAAFVSRSVVGLYKTRIESRANVTESGKLNTPSPTELMVIANFALTALLVGVGGRNRARELPLAPIVLSAKIIADALTNFYLSKQAWRSAKVTFRIRQTTALLSIASFVLSIPEAREALRVRKGNLRFSKDMKQVSAIYRSQATFA